MSLRDKASVSPPHFWKDVAIQADHCRPKSSSANSAWEMAGARARWAFFNEPAKGWIKNCHCDEKASWAQDKNLHLPELEFKIESGLDRVSPYREEICPAPKLPGGDDVQRVYIVNESALVSNGDGVLAEKDKFGMRGLKLLPIRRANRKRTETATAYPLFQLLQAHAINLNQPPTGVKTIRILSLKQGAGQKSSPS